MKELQLTERQDKLLGYVRFFHGSQVRKYTGEPYWTHPLAVAKLVRQHANEYLVFEIALCHDLLEDTECTEVLLLEILISIGYTVFESYNIVKATVELTDVYTHERFPNLNRQMRKANEAIRLGTVSDIAQNVKFADLIDNTISIVRHDKGFAKVYLKEKERVLTHMHGGNAMLRTMCQLSLKDSIQQLNSEGK
jgi:(p)ppGpp synthase/HD superfamily hydrolase